MSAAPMVIVEGLVEVQPNKLVSTSKRCKRGYTRKPSIVAKGVPKKEYIIAQEFVYMR